MKLWLNFYQDGDGPQVLTHITNTRELAILAAERENKALGRLVARVTVEPKHGEGLTASEASKLSQGVSG